LVVAAFDQGEVFLTALDLEALGEQGRVVVAPLIRRPATR
jgi:hypothetical protein